MIKLRVDSIKRELPDTATFYLSTTSAEKIRYSAGQFLTLIFQHHNEEIRRSYSLSSSPDEELLAITVKRVVNGEISRFLLTKVHPGDILFAAEPAGKFTVSNHDDQKDIFLFAAGSGISPVFSQLKYILNRPGASKVHLIYSSQSVAHIIFRNELEELAINFKDRFNLVHLLSSEAKRLNNLVVEQLVNKLMCFDKGRAEFYLCGPFTYMRMIRLSLHYMHIEDNKIRRENFVVDAVSVSKTYKNFPPKNIKIAIHGELHDVQQGEDQSILQAALQNKIQLPYSCRNGVCSACVAYCKSGKVEMVRNDVLTEKDLSQGWILTCTGHAITDDVVIEYK
ncbi:oxidoreductase [Mucilaginibacter terrenus]|uniref:Oxidoreductase n=1 Tax=Mucilaginibacter terrenus TaxID=2482727 RepID=A0A3E2NQA6_9SPHI|nr:ferredoxin--NADP reductase [Mucilaginibacter terrenus]RFZ83153.1 oxidoreductase [Mucilaginibacter terrenus]